MILKQVDVAIIGTGTVGMVAYRVAKKHTDNVVVIDLIMEPLVRV